MPLLNLETIHRATSTIQPDQTAQALRYVAEWLEANPTYELQKIETWPHALQRGALELTVVAVQKEGDTRG